MANILEYTLSLNDKLSSKLSTIGINSNSALNKFSQLQKQSLAVAKVMNDFGGSVGALREKLSLLKNERDWISPKNIEQLRRYNSEIKKTERELQRLETINGSRSKKWLGDAMSQIPMAGLLTNPLVIAGAAAGKAVKLGIEQDLQNTAFEVLLNSKGAAKKLVDDITKYGISTPYDKAGLAENAKVLLGFGLAQEKIMPSLKAIGDLAMGDANKMSSLTLAFAQVSSAGKLSGQDLLQMINAGFNPLNEIAKRTGKSIAQLKEDMSDGKVSAKMVEDAFIAATSAGGTFHGMAEKMGQTLGGKLAQLMDQISEKFLKLYNVIQPLVVFFVDVFSVAIDIVADTLGWFFDGIKTGNPAIILLAGSIGVLALAYSAVSIKMRITNIFGKEGIIVSKASAVAKGIEASAVWAVEVATKALNLAMKLTPFGLILTGIAGLIAAYEALSISKKKAMEEYQEDANKRSQESMRSEIDVVEQLTEKYKQLSRSKAYKGQDEVLSKMAITDEQKRLAAELKQYDKIFLQKRVEDIKLKMDQNPFNNNSLDNELDEIIKKRADIDNRIAILNSLNPQVIVDRLAAKKLLNSSGEMSNKNNLATKTNKDIATGGQKHNYITINLKDLIGMLNINVKDLQQGTDQMKEQATDALLRVLNMATATGG